MKIKSVWKYKLLFQVKLRSCSENYSLLAVDPENSTRLVPISVQEKLTIRNFARNQIGITLGIFGANLLITKLFKKSLKHAFIPSSVFAGSYLVMGVPVIGKDHFSNLDLSGNSYMKFIFNKFFDDYAFQVTNKLQEEYFQNHPKELEERIRNIVNSDGEIFYLDELMPKNIAFRNYCNLSPTLTDHIEKTVNKYFT